MCGLVGFTGTPLPSVIQAMTDRITHRGPDDQGIWSDDALSLGHRRLSILDLTSAGHQPMLSPDGRYVLAFNGEIYTHQTIRDELADRVTFRSSSDTETLLHGLMHFGEELLPRLNGIFAFAFYDAQTHQLLIARDQFGIKPLYYTLAGDRLAFASELKSLLDLPGWSRAIDPKGIANYLTFLWSPGGHTAFESVRKLTAGAYAKFDLSKPVSEVQEVSYYRPPFGAVSSSECFRRGNEATEQKNWEQAIALYGSAVSLVPDNLTFRQLLRATTRKKFKDNGHGLGRQANEELKSIHARISIAKTSFNWSDIDRACEEGLLLNPWDSLLLAEHAQANLALNRTDIARESYRLACLEGYQNEELRLKLAERPDSNMKRCNLPSTDSTSGAGTKVKSRSQQGERELTDELDERLQLAVERQLLSDVPVGFFLSGGLDSSLLVALARKIRPEAQLQAFTIDTTGVEATEGFVSDLDYAKQVARHLQVDLEVVDPSCDLLKLFARIIWHLDEPQADAAPMNVLAICERARAMGYKVLIGGAAADDLFSGYRRHEALALEKWFQALPGPIASLVGAAARCLPARPAVLRRFRKLAEGLGKSATDRMVGYFGWMEQSRIFELLSPTVRQQLAGFDPLDQLREMLREIPTETSPLNQMLYLELRSFLVDHNLNYTDKLSMATSVEVRVPFLDLDLVEFSTTIPPELKMQGRTTKYLLRKVAERYLPHDVIYRPKAGFGGPVRKWVLDDLAPLISTRLSPERIRARGLFDPAAVQKLLDDNRAGRIDAAYTVWTLLAIESWCEQFVDRQAA
jgi:asparagine synthase (glutamine-hydrolysing)